MRITVLDLLRYGRFTDVALQFPAAELDFHVIFGENEAGKSTSLAAIENLLFGIPHNSQYNFVHDYASMRLGGIIQHGGELLHLRRRKGNKDTLLGPDDVPLASGESALAPFLRGADQTFFTRMFSLNHERLARGGREILEAKDEVGQALFSAGSGVAGLHNQIGALAKEAEELWAPRKAGHRKYYQALDALEEADRQLREHTITANKWHETKRTFDDAQQACAGLESEIEILSAELRKLNRVRRVYRHVGKLAELEQEGADLGDVALLPEDADARFEAATQEESSARSKIEVLDAQLDRAQEERAGLICDEKILSRAFDVEQLHKQRIEVEKERADLPKRRAELEGAEKRLQDLAGELGWSLADVDDILSHLPQRAKVTATRALLAERGELASTLKAATASAEDIHADIQELQRELQDADSGLDVSALAAVIGAARELGEIGSRIASAENKVTDGNAAMTRRLKALRPQVACEQALAEIPVPPRSTVQDHRDAVRALEEDLKSCNERIRVAEEKIVQLQKACARKIDDEAVVSADDVARARAERQQGWSLIRRHYIEGNAVTEEELATFRADAADAPEAYERRVEAVDGLADRRFEKAQAAGEIAAIACQIEEQQELIQALHDQRALLDNKVVELDSAWEKLWAEASFEPLAPDFMLGWLEARKELIDVIERQALAVSETATLKQQEADARSRIIAELLAVGENVECLERQPLRVVLEGATLVQQRHEKRAESKAALEERIRKLEADESRKKAGLEKAKVGWREWQGKWSAALAHLELVETASVDSVADQLDTIEQMRGVEKEITQLRRERIGKIERDIERFAACVVGLVTIIADDLLGGEPDDAVVALERRLDDARRTHEQQLSKDKAITSFKEKIEECEAVRREAHTALRELRELAGVDETDALRSAISKSRRRRDIDTERSLLEKTLISESDGLSLPELRQECEAVDLDQIAAREETLRTELTDLRRRQTEAAEHRAHARQAFEAIGGDHQAANAAAARQEALARMRDVAEHYVRVRTSALLLRWAIERYRREKQTPLLKRAGQMFATLTSQSFCDLRVEYDDQDTAHLAGIRPDESTVHVGGMSDGTADQLYLALRLASVDEYLSRAHSLPFVADDLFINFDDTRSAAGFRVLADLSRKTQVLFFTHHQHLVDIAKATVGSTINVVPLNPERQYRRSEREALQHLQHHRDTRQADTIWTVPLSDSA